MVMPYPERVRLFPPNPVRGVSDVFVFFFLCALLCVFGSVRHQGKTFSPRPMKGVRTVFVLFLLGLIWVALPVHSLHNLQLLSRV